MRVHAQKQNQSQRQVSPNITRSNAKPPPANHTVHSILHLQRTIGNQAVQRLLHPNAEALEAGSDTTPTSRFAHDLSRIPVSSEAPVRIQAKLTLNTPGDRYEQEADRVSEQVMRMPKPQLQRACSCGGEGSKWRTKQAGQKHGGLQTKRVESGDFGETSAPSNVDEVSGSSGRSLDAATRAFMEPRFGYDFSKVRIHTNDGAAESAQAVNALAYTVGNNIFFRVGQYAPSSSDGQELLAHELAHVVQQDGGQTSHDGDGGRHGISRAPTSVIARRIPPDWQEEVPDWYWEGQKKKAAIKKHEDEQRTVIDLMDKARNLQPDPTKGITDPDNLLRNTVQMFDAGRFRLTVLSPTHYSNELHFDPGVKHPTVGGDYPERPPKDPKTPGPQLVYEPSASGRTIPAPRAGAIGQIQSLPPKVERAPDEPAPKETPTPAAKISTAPPTFLPFLQGDVYIFTRGTDVVTQFRQIFVHEGQHVADLSTQRVAANSLDEKLEAYKSEFRAFWIQPHLQRTTLLDPGGTRFAEPTGKAENSKKVTISDPQKNCTLCPPGDSSGKAFAEPKTAMKNARQEEIFWHILNNYTKHQFDCCYVYNEQFHKAVNEFAYPQSVNLINSERLMNLDLELQNLKKDMTRAQVGGTNLVGALTKLEPLDWAFLIDPKLAKPFWDTLNANAPEFVENGVKGLLKKGLKAAVSEADANKALSR